MLKIHPVYKPNSENEIALVMTIVRENLDSFVPSVCVCGLTLWHVASTLFYLSFSSISSFIIIPPIFTIISHFLLLSLSSLLPCFLTCIPLLPSFLDPFDFSAQFSFLLFYFFSFFLNSFSIFLYHIFFLLTLIHFFFYWSNSFQN